MADCDSPTSTISIQDVNPEETTEPDLPLEKLSEVKPKPSKSGKIDILLKPTPNAPIMAKKKWSVDPDKKVGMVIEFIKKYLKLDASEHLFNILLNMHQGMLGQGEKHKKVRRAIWATDYFKARILFLYVNQAFAPAPDQLIRTLYDCYEIDGKLILHYSLGQAWG